VFVVTAGLIAHKIGEEGARPVRELLRGVFHL